MKYDKKTILDSFENGHEFFEEILGFLDNRNDGSGLHSEDGLLEQLSSSKKQCVCVFYSVKPEHVRIGDPKVRRKYFERKWNPEAS